MRPGRVGLLGWFASMAMAALASAPVAASPAAGGDVSCRGADVSVIAGLHRMHGTLCIPAGEPVGTVMVLVAGASYNHTYWDFPYEPHTYNFRRAMNAAGYATFVVDRLGTGESSRPLSATLTSTIQAGAVHEVIAELRAGAIGGNAFDKVILGGHSLGSIVSILEASTYRDVDAVLLTGIGHWLNAEFAAGEFATSLHLAALDSKFADGGYDPGYVTTRPGTRGELFHDPATADPNLVAADEETKDVFAATDIADGALAAPGPATLRIRAPVLIANGDRDRLFCSSATGNCDSAQSFRAQEAPYFTSAACLRVYMLAGAGHNPNLATNAPDYQGAVREWADAFVGAGPGPAPRPCI